MADNKNIFGDIKTYADNLIGEDGVQFTVEANLHPSNYIYIGMSIAAGMIAGSLMTILIKKITKTQ